MIDPRVEAREVAEDQKDDRCRDARREAFRQLGSVVIADLRRKKEAERLSALSLLRPMD